MWSFMRPKDTQKNEKYLVLHRVFINQKSGRYTIR